MLADGIDDVEIVGQIQPCRRPLRFEVFLFQHAAELRHDPFLHAVFHAEYYHNTPFIVEVVLTSVDSAAGCAKPCDPIAESFGEGDGIDFPRPDMKTFTFTAVPAAG